MFSLSGKKALVTGGGSGIGLAVVERFLAAGAEVIAADLVMSESLDAIGAGFIAVDVANEAQVADAFSQVEQRLGKLDIVVNNAGIALEEAPIVDTDVSAFDRTLDVNLKGVLFGLKYAPRHMNDSASIINTASLAATATLPEYSGYSVSKSGVVKLTRQAALELGARNIRVNAVCPGTTTTPMEPADSDESQLCRYTTALGRPGLPQEQAAVYHFLASDDSSYVNGQAINVDGCWVNGITYAAMEKLMA